MASFPASISVSPAAAIVQTGLLNGPPAALVAADAALRQATEADPARRGIGATTPESLQEAVAAYTHTSGIAPVRQILRLADAEGVPPAVAADRLAERRMAEVGRLRTIHLR